MIPRSIPFAPIFVAAPAVPAVAVEFDGPKIEALTGRKGALNANEGVFKVGFPRTEVKAVVDGDFAMHEDEVQPTLKALRKGGINIVAIHQHVLGEQPRIIFLHFRGRGPAVAPARTVKSALDIQAVRSRGGTQTPGMRP